MMKRFIALLAALGMIIATPAMAAMQDCSGTTAASVKNVYSASNTRGFVIVNNSANLMCISFYGNAAAGIGGSFMSPEGFSPTRVTIVSAAGAGDIYSCQRW
jgi:hypothetical protein